MKKIFLILLVLFISSTIYAQSANYQQLAQDAARNLSRNEQEYNRLLALLNESQNNSRFISFQTRLNGLQRQIEAQEKIVEDLINRPAVIVNIRNALDELVRLNDRYKSVEAQYREWLNSLR